MASEYKTMNKCIIALVKRLYAMEEILSETWKYVNCLQKIQFKEESFCNCGEGCSWG